MPGPQPFRKRPSTVHRRAGHARPLRHCYNKKRLFALCIVGWGLDRSLQGNGKQAFSCSQNKKARSLFAGENALNLC